MQTRARGDETRLRVEWPPTRRRAVVRAAATRDSDELPAIERAGESEMEWNLEGT